MNKDQRKGITIIMIGIMILPTIIAIEWQEQRRTAKEIARENNYKGELRFAYYEERKIWAEYKFKEKKEMITFYKGSLNTDKETFKCLVLHEIGHSKEVKEKKIKQGKLNETYADKWMKEKEENCENWY